MIIDRMINSPPSYTDTQWNEIEVKFASIEDRISMHLTNAIMEYLGEKIGIEDSKKKPKPYYRRGRWE